MAAAEPRHHDSLATVLVAGTRDALRSGEFERARILLALALRAELRDEETEFFRPVQVGTKLPAGSCCCNCWPCGKS